jgi:predicted N-acetyltransferase YhbS
VQFTRAWPNRDDGEVAMLVFGDLAFYGRFG